MINIQDIIPFMKDGWVAMDKDGAWCWFSHKPILKNGLDFWCLSACSMSYTIPTAFDIAPADDWTKSLIKVDHFSQEGKKVGGK